MKYNLLKYSYALEELEIIKMNGRVIRVVGLIIESEGPIVQLGEHCYIKMVNSDKKIDENRKEEQSPSIRSFVIIRKNGTKEVYNQYETLHREKGPAVIYPNGDKEWWCRGLKHRDNGPAVIIGNKQFWFEYGEFIKYKDSSEHSIIPKTKNFFKAFASLILPKRKKKSVS